VEEETLKVPRNTWIDLGFLALLIIVVALCITWGPSGLVGLLFAFVWVPLGVGPVVWGWRRVSVARRRPMAAGVQTCPGCGSLQTDRVEAGGWQCFACDHRWG
jgi:hypothetical protein